MGILLKKIHRPLPPTSMVKLSLIFFVVSLSAAFIDTVWALYLKEFLHGNSTIGFYSPFLSALAFISSFILVPFIEKRNKPALYSLCLFLTGLFFVAFALNKNLIIFFLLTTAVTIMFTTRMITRAIIIKDGSEKKTLSKNEGIVFSFNNVAWVLGPLIAAFILVEFGISHVFLFSAGLAFIGFLLFRMANVKSRDGKIDGNAMGILFEYFKNRDRIIIYLLAMGVSFWWALIYLYIPLYMIEGGLGKGTIGIFLFLIAIPLVFLEYPFSKISGERGARNFFLIAYSMMAAISLFLFFVNDVFLVLGVLIFASIPMAMLEPTTEAYFFDILKRKNDGHKFYGPFSTSLQAGFILGKIVPATVILFLPFNYVFPVFGMFFALLFFLSLGAKNVIEDGKKN